MQDFWFYVVLGFNHVMDLAAYDHMLFLAALSIPFTFRQWKDVLLLATLFAGAHCFSLALSAYQLVSVDTSLIEFLIPVTILLTAAFNIVYTLNKVKDSGIITHGVLTTFFGLIHGFGFSNYFNILVAQGEQKLGPLLGFATGIEISQALIIFSMLALIFLTLSFLKFKKSVFILISSTIIALATIPMMIKTFPW